MDSNRFDAFTRRLGTRRSRREIMRASAGAALGAVALGALRPAAAQDAGTQVTDRFISVRTYPYNAGTEEVAQQGLQGLVGVMEQQPGFIAYDLVFAGNAILAISVFLDESTAVAAASQEDAWIQANAATILTGAPTIASGDVFLGSNLGTGCGCTTGTEDACGADGLVCCGTSDLMGGPGICLNTQTTCPAAPPAPASPTAEPACTASGCACNGGVQGACDDGLVCCQGDTSIPGGAGICTATADCNPGTPSPVCTGEGCQCASGTENPCDDGLECCGATMP